MSAPRNRREFSVYWRRESARVWLCVACMAFTASACFLVITVASWSANPMSGVFALCAVGMFSTGNAMLRSRRRLLDDANALATEPEGRRS